jgi:hypothetical protein
MNLVGVQWFEGYDGQVVLDGSYLWITREDVPDHVSPGLSREARRVHRDSIAAATFKEASDSRRGSIRIQLLGEPERKGDQQDASAVEFSIGSNERFCRLHGLISGASEVDELELSPEDQLRTILDQMEGVATYSELTDELGYAPESRVSIDRVSWGWVGGIRLAVGGDSDTSYDDRAGLIRSLNQLTVTCPFDAGTKTLRAAAMGTSLQQLTVPRLAALWEALAPVVSTATVATPQPVVKNPPAQSVSDTRALVQPPAPPPFAAPTRTSSKPDLIDKGATARKKQSAPIRPQTPVSHLLPSATMGQASLFSGTRMRVTIAVAGFNTKALYDPATGSMEITRAPYRALLRTKYANPHLAAEAVVKISGMDEGGTCNGWDLWRPDDRSSRTLGDVRDIRHP